MTGDLEDRVGGSVDDRLPGGDVLVAEVLDDTGTGSRPVAQDAAADGALEWLHHLRRKTVWVGREGALEDDAHHLPVTGGRVFAGATLEKPAVGRLGPRRAQRQADHGAQTEADKIG